MSLLRDMLKRDNVVVTGAATQKPIQPIPDFAFVGASVPGAGARSKSRWRPGPGRAPIASPIDTKIIFCSALDEIDETHARVTGNSVTIRIAAFPMSCATGRLPLWSHAFLLALLVIEQKIFFTSDFRVVLA